MSHRHLSFFAIHASHNYTSHPKLNIMTWDLVNTFYILSKNNQNIHDVNSYKLCTKHCTAEAYIFLLIITYKNKYLMIMYNSLWFFANTCLYEAIVHESINEKFWSPLILELRIEVATNVAAVYFWSTQLNLPWSRLILVFLRCSKADVMYLEQAILWNPY